MPSKRVPRRHCLKAGAGIIALLAASACGVRPSAPASQSTPSAAGQPAPAAAQHRPRPEPPQGPPNYLHAEGSKLVDSRGTEVRLTGVNWFGLETGTFAPHGLWERNYEDMLDQIASLGYNTIRLPYSNQLFEPLSLPEGIDYELNPDLRGLTGLQVMDKVIDGAGRRGLKIILDRHRPDVEKQTNLWYSDRISEERWIDDWKLLAARYLGNDTVIGADLHNEPHNDGEKNSFATWGDGNPRTDWRMAAEKAGNAILGVNPNWLIIVEGIESYNSDWYWWGGNLQGAAKYPVRLDVPNRLVYSAHDYGPGVWTQSWFSDPAFPRNLPAVWRKQWGYLAEQNVAPVLMGEFGGRRSDADSKEGQWQRALLAYLKEHGISYTYWAFNANSADTGGILDEEDTDWRAVDQGKQALLATYQAPSIPTGQYSKIDLAATPSYQTDTSGRAKLDGDLRVQYHPDDDYLPGDPKLPGAADAPTNARRPYIRLLNVGTEPLPLAGLELRYWFRDASAAQRAAVDWSTVGAAGVSAEVVRAGSVGQDYYLKLTFGKDAGTILGKGGVVDIQASVSRADGSPFLQTEDYSFDHGRDAEHLKEFRPTDRIALYSGGKLIWGAEPVGSGAPVASRPVASR